MKKTQSGQALLILLLIMMIGLTVGLGVISRSVTDIRISRQEEESARVFSVAEAGIEEALKLGDAPPGGVTIGGITATVSKSDLGGGGWFVFEEEIAAGDIQTVWLVGHTGDALDPAVTYIGNQIELDWGNAGSGEVTALEATLIYKESDVFKLARYAIDPGGRGGFVLPDEEGSFSVGGKNFKYRKTISFPSSLSIKYYALRLRLLYNTEPQSLGVVAVGVPMGSLIPPQGKCYESTARLEATGITRKVRQCTYYKAPPGIFDYVLYSEQELVHQ